MANLRTMIVRRSFSLLIALSLVGLPLTGSVAAYADDPAPCTPPPASNSFHYPNGADSGTFTYNCTTGLWQNAHFTYDPSTGVRTALDPTVYTCDPATNTYNVTTWFYSPSQGTFLSATQNVAQPPAGATVVACPPPPAPPVAAGTSPTGQNSGSPATNSGVGGSNTTDTSLNNTANLSNANNLTVGNLLNSTAGSGNAVALSNTTVGNVGSGNADIVATEMNMLQSAANFGTSGGQPITFVANIKGDVNGDFLLDPSTIASVQPATSNNNTDINNSLTINNTTNATLNNTLNLNATSGDATANTNTTAGNVKTGNADIVANVVNTINSAITAGNSFLGIININGNLNGDILLPPDFVNQLLAANVPTVTITGPSTGSTSNTAASNTTNVTNTNNQGINNNVHATATSGTASANQNTNVGNVSSGTATTNITAFNLTGSQVIGSNDLLVFVNVLGQWVGLIVNSPPGTTAAELGGGITAANSNTTVNNTSNTTNNTTQQINNNINLNAQSGNATANKNTTVGNVSSGDAKGAVNLLNVENSTLTLTNWFGILFINVFGSWNGSFGVNTSAGDPIIAAAGNTGGTPAGLAAFRFVPASGNTAQGTFFAPFTGQGGGGNATESAAGTGTAAPTGAILAAATSKSDNHQLTSTAPAHANWFVIIASSSLFAAYLVGERLYAVKQQSRA